MEKVSFLGSKIRRQFRAVNEYILLALVERTSLCLCSVNKSYERKLDSLLWYQVNLIVSQTKLNPNQNLFLILFLIFSVFFFGEFAKVF